MHIVIDGIVYSFQKYGGINTFFNEVMSRLARRDGVTIEVLLPRRHAGEPAGPPVRTVPRELLPERTGWSWKLDQMLQPALRRLNTLHYERRLRGRDTVFASTYFTWPSSRVPQVAVALDMNHELFPELYQDEIGRRLRVQYREYLRRATRVIAISRQTKADALKFYDLAEGSIDVVHLAVARDVFWPDPAPRPEPARMGGLAPGVPYFLFVGGRWTYKNFNGMLEGFARSRAASTHALVFTGTPWKQDEEELIARHGLQSKVHLVVNPDPATLRVLYCRATAFVYPSLHEGFGLPLLEAMACNAWVLASDIPVFHEVAGDAALYFNPSDPGALAAALDQAVDPRHGVAYVARGAEQVQGFSWDRAASETYDVLRRALNDLRR